MKRKSTNKKRLKTRPRLRRKPMRRTKRASGGIGNSQPRSMVSKPSTQIQRGSLPFAQVYYVRLPYSNTEVLTATNGNLATVTSYRLNSLFDPLTAVGGTQPYQYDQLTTLYSIYKVFGAKVKVTFHDPSADGIYVGYRVRASTNTTVTNNQNIRLLGTYSSTQVKPLANSGSQTASFSGFVKMHEVLGISREQYSDESAYQSSTAANPSTDILIEPFVVDMNNGSSATVKCSISIIYYAQMFGYYSPTES